MLTALGSMRHVVGHSNFQLEGGIGNVSPRVPEPASLVLVVVGMSGLGLVSRTLFAVRCRENDRGALR